MQEGRYHRVSQKQQCCCLPRAGIPTRHCTSTTLLLPLQDSLPLAGSFGPGPGPTTILTSTKGDKESSNKHFCTL